VAHATTTRTPASNPIDRDFGSPPYGHFHPLPWVVATAAQLLAAGVPAAEIPERMGMTRRALVMAFFRWGNPPVRAAFFRPGRPGVLTPERAPIEARAFLDTLPQSRLIQRARRDAMRSGGGRVA
jgi:hypothetical protein